MKYGVYLTGAFGQSGELYKSRNEAKRGRGSQKAVEAQILKDTKTIIDSQIEAKLSFVIDPMFKFYYLLQPFAERVNGVSIGPQENWFNNNVFYWRPQINGPLQPATDFTNDYLHFDLLPKDGSAMVILPSPYTLIMLSDVKGYPNKRSAIIDLSELIAEEAQTIVEKHNVGRIQYDEPAIVVKQSLGSMSKEDLSLLELAMAYCGKMNGATTSLHTYFGDAGPILDFLYDLPVDCIGIDATETRLQNMKSRFSDKELAIGLVNARSADIENPRDLTERLRRIADTTQPKALWFTTNTATEYIGWTLALGKMEVLEEAKRTLEEK